MDLALQLVTVTCIIIGMMVMIIGVVGLFRFPDFYTKVHAASIIDAFAIPITVCGLIVLCFLLKNESAYAIKLTFILVSLLILNPLSSHLLINTSYYNSCTTKED